MLSLAPARLAALIATVALAGCAAANASPATVKTAATYQSNELDPTTIVVVAATAKVKPGTEEAFKAAAADLVAATRQEDGNLAYVFDQSNDDPTEFLFQERWASAAALDTHMNGPVLGSFFALVKGDFEPGFPVIKRYHQLSR